MKSPRQPGSSLAVRPLLDILTVPHPESGGGERVREGSASHFAPAVSLASHRLLEGGRLPSAGSPRHRR